MPQVRAEFNYQPSADAQRYEIFYGTQRLGFSDTLQFTTDLELEYGTHNFSVRGVNVDGTGPFRSTQVVLEEPYVPLPTPGPIGALEVSLVILGGGVGGGEPPVVPPSGDNAARIGAILNGRSPHFLWNMPADPVTTREVTVTSAAQFNSEASVPGTRIIVNNSFAGDIFLTADDLDIVMSNSATISGVLNIGTVSFINRIRWTGGNIKNITGRRFNDFLIDDVYAVASEEFSGGGLPEHSFNIGAYDNNRLAIINTTLEVAGIPPPNVGYGAWALHSSYVTDSFIGNVRCISNHQNNRMAAVTRRLIVDSVFNPDGQSSNAMRIHDGSTDVWIKDSWSRNFMKLDGPGVQVTNALFDNYDRYWDTPSNWGADGLDTGVWQNSTLYNPQIYGGWSYGPSFTAGVNQTEVVWDGSTIDYSDMPGKSSINDYGASAR